MSEKLSIKELDLKGKVALIRVDFNVPIENGIVVDDTRIRSTLPTLQYVLDQGGSIILMSHLGRPKGTAQTQYSLAPCAKELEKLLNRPVKMAPDCRGSVVKQMASSLKPGDILLLENLRFHKGEENPESEPTFASALANLGDVYINDAFGTAHRAHASTTTIAQFFPNQAAAGFLMLKEIDYLGKTLQNPKRPFYSILGGAKISSKFKTIESLIKKADKLLIGGAMAFTFFKAEGIKIGDSLFEPDYITVARQLLDVSSQSRCPLLLPIDLVITRTTESTSEWKVIDIEEGIPDHFQGVDIGPKTVQMYLNELQNASTIFWNGPLGVFEVPPFDKGTLEIAKGISASGAITVIGGGDSLAAIEKAGVADRISHLSTGGGATLEYIEFGDLPGIQALSDRAIK